MKFNCKKVGVTDLDGISEFVERLGNMDKSIKEVLLKSLDGSTESAQLFIVTDENDKIALKGFIVSGDPECFFYYEIMYDLNSSQSNYLFESIIKYLRKWRAPKEISVINAYKMGAEIGWGKTGEADRGECGEIDNVEICFWG